MVFIAFPPTQLVQTGIWVGHFDVFVFVANDQWTLLFFFSFFFFLTMDPIHLGKVPLS